MRLCVFVAYSCACGCVQATVNEHDVRLLGTIVSLIGAYEEILWPLYLRLQGLQRCHYRHRQPSTDDDAFKDPFAIAVSIMSGDSGLKKNLAQKVSRINSRALRKMK